MGINVKCCVKIPVIRRDAMSTKILPYLNADIRFKLNAIKQLQMELCVLKNVKSYNLADINAVVLVVGAWREPFINPVIKNALEY